MRYLFALSLAACVSFSVLAIRDAMLLNEEMGRAQAYNAFYDLHWSEDQTASMAHHWKDTRHSWTLTSF